MAVLCTLLLALCSTGLLAPSGAAPVAGFVEEWSSGTNGWGGGAEPPDNPGTGGYLGDGDGYLRVFTTFPWRLGTFSLGNEYLGDWAAAGITKVGVWLNDVNTDEALEIHFSIGTANVNYWQYDIGFLPPENAWGQFVVDLSSDLNWTRIIGAGTFLNALQNVDRAHWRHDRPPFMQAPDHIQADVGIDHMLLTNGLAGLEPRAAVRAPIELLPPAPNPSRGPVSFTLRVPEPSAVRIEVVDVGGRRVRTAGLAEGDAGLRVWVWDGRDDSGALVAAGVYRVRAWGPSGGTSRSVVRIP